jgi:hypothetical protein
METLGQRAQHNGASKTYRQLGQPFLSEHHKPQAAGRQLLYSLQAPPIAVFKVKKFIRFLVIGNLKVYCIPFNWLATHSQTDISELTSFG